MIEIDYGPAVLGTLILLVFVAPCDIWLCLLIALRPDDRLRENVKIIRSISTWGRLAKTKQQYNSLTNSKGYLQYEPRQYAGVSTKSVSIK